MIQFYKKIQWYYSPYLSVLDFLKSLFHEIDFRTWFLNMIFFLFWTSFLQATQAVKIKFEIDKKSSSKIKFKNQFRELKISRVNLCNLSSRDLLDNFILSDYLSGTAKRSNGVIVPDTKDSPYLSALDFWNL